MKNNKKIGVFLIIAILLLSFKSAKRKGSIIVSPLEGNNIYALPGGYLYGSDPARPIYTFKGGELLTLIADTGMGDYQIEYIAPGGNKVTGYINIFDTEIK
jgi:hypothetical protein